MKKKGNVTPPKKHNNYPVIEPKEKKMIRIPEKELKLIIWKKFCKIHKNTNGQNKEIRKMIHNWNKKFSKDIEVIKKNATETLELNNSINKIKSIIESFTYREILIKQKR